jgi:MFS transporter, DHA1 family, multidrug resistance protein
MVFTSVSSVWAIISGLIGPFYVVYVEKMSGGMEKLGIAFSIMVLFQSLTSYLSGHFSDRIGRKPFLFLTAYADAIVLFLYTLIQGTYQLYILQGILGITNGITNTISTSLLGDLTMKEKRGTSVGKFHAIVGLSSAVGLSLSGYIAKFYGLKSLFYIASLIVAFSTIFLFFIKEENHSESEF